MFSLFLWHYLAPLFKILTIQYFKLKELVKKREKKSYLGICNKVIYTLGPYIQVFGHVATLVIDPPQANSSPLLNFE